MRVSALSGGFRVIPRIHAKAVEEMAAPNNATYILKVAHDQLPQAELFSAQTHKDLQDIGTNTHVQIDAHIGDNTIHFTLPIPESSVTFDDSTGHTHSGAGNTGTKISHADLTNITSSDHHTKTVSGDIDHLLIQNIGTNSHADIDSHIADTTDPHGAAMTVSTSITTPEVNTGANFTLSAGGTINLSGGAVHSNDLSMNTNMLFTASNLGVKSQILYNTADVYIRANVSSATSVIHIENISSGGLADLDVENDVIVGNDLRTSSIITDSGDLSINPVGNTNITGEFKATNTGGRVDLGLLTVTSGLSSAGTDLLTIGTDNQLQAYVFSAGTGAYTYNIDLDKTGAREGQSWVIRITKPASTNPTIRVRNGSGGTNLISINNANSETIACWFFFDGNNWNKFFAHIADY